MSQQKRERKIGVGVIIWLILALALLIAFLVKRDDILATLKRTEFFTHLLGSEPAFVENYQIKGEPPADVPATQTSSPVIIQDNSGVNTDLVVEFQDLSTIDLNSLSATESALPAPITSADELTAIPQEPLPSPSDVLIETPYGTITAEQSAGLVTEYTDVRLFFVQLNNDGSVSRKEVVRSIPKTNSPLTAAINSLLEGPNSDDVIQNCMTLIPAGTRLLSASVKDKVATLNFSDDFEFNSYGVDGLVNQLMQVVYTACSFSSVNSVQFIIDGQKKEYLGSEGIWIGTPLSVTSFK
ncbi:MAG: GerMN domain-containing protein [Spirochaetaceae bacterium]|nr:GerMN domain-containing protein [Spirochaetaceae bacterium]